MQVNKKPWFALTNRNSQITRLNKKEASARTSQWKFSFWHSQQKTSICIDLMLANVSCQFDWTNSRAQFVTANKKPWFNRKSCFKTANLTASRGCWHGGVLSLWCAGGERAGVRDPAAEELVPRAHRPVLRLPAGLVGAHALHLHGVHARRECTPAPRIAIFPLKFFPDHNTWSAEPWTWVVVTVWWRPLTLAGFHQGPAEVIRGSDRKRDAALYPADPGGGVLPAQQYDRPPGHQRSALTAAVMLHLWVYVKRGKIWRCEFLFSFFFSIQAPTSCVTQWATWSWATSVPAGGSRPSACQGRASCPWPAPPTGWARRWSAGRATAGRLISGENPTFRFHFSSF